MAQHDYNIGDQNGFDFLVDLNNALSAIATNNAGSFEPNPTFAHMLWFDTNNDLMKVRNEANSEWRIVAKKDGSGWTPYRQGTALGTASTLDTSQVAPLSNPTLGGMTTTTRLRTTSGNDATPTGTDHPYQIGLDAGLNVRFDDNAIGAFDNGGGSRLTLNRYGGGVAIGSSGATLDPTGTAPLFACRAWVNFDGTGTVAIRASGNVSSITDNGAGDYTINFATALPDANYAINTTIGTFSATDAGDRGVGVATNGYTGSIINMTTSAIRILTGPSEDTSLVMASIFR